MNPVINDKVNLSKEVVTGWNLFYKKDSQTDDVFLQTIFIYKPYWKPTLERSKFWAASIYVMNHYVKNPSKIRCHDQEFLKRVLDDFKKCGLMSETEKNKRGVSVADRKSLEEIKRQKIAV